MATEKRTYSVNNIKQLIDLNDDLTNFDISFTVTSQTGQPFDILVVDQTTLDNNPDLEYKKVTDGRISGSVRNDKGVYQNYFLILRSDNPTTCDVEISKKEIPKAVQQPKMVQQRAQPPPKKEQTSWTKVALIVGVVLAGGFVLYWLSKKKSSSEDTTGENNQTGFKFYEPSYSPSLNGSANGSSHGSPNGSELNSLIASPENPILQKIKNLNL